MDRQEYLESLFARLRRLRGTGPVQPEFYQWVGDARQFLAATYGDPSPQLASFTRAVYEGTDPDDAYMHHDGPWGLYERIAKAEALLVDLTEAAPASLGKPAT